MPSNLLSTHLHPAPPPTGVGLIGLGLMGRGLGLSLLRAGHAVTVLAHQRRAVADELLAAGAAETTTAAALAAVVDVLVLCLPSQEAVDTVLLGPQGVCGAFTPDPGHQVRDVPRNVPPDGAPDDRHDDAPDDTGDDTRAGTRSRLLVIECSTLTPEAGRRLAQRLAEQGIDWVDAPVTRGPAEAVQGRLNALVGGSDAAVARAEPVLRAFCETVFRFGGNGQGYAAKLVNNFLAFSNLVAVAEALHTARSAGLDLPTMLAAVQLSGGQSRVLDGLTPLLSGSGPARSRVTLDTAHKDAHYYHLLAQSLGTAGPVARQVEALLAQALAAGLGGHFTPDYLDQVAGRRPL